LTTRKLYGREGSDASRRNKISQEYWNESTHTILSYWFCLIATGIEFFLGIQHINEYFGQMCLVEAFFGISGLLLLDPIHGRRFQLYPKPFKRVHKNTFFRFAITFSIIVAIQFIFQVVPLITSTEMALGIVMCAPVEEYFFRGVLMEPSFIIAKKSKNKITIWKYPPRKKKPDKEISYVEIGMIFLSAAIFSSVHVNYYGQLNLLLMVFAGGCWLSFIYWWNRDLTPLILSHFLLNIFFVYQYYMVVGL